MPGRCEAPGTLRARAPWQLVCDCEWEQGYFRGGGRIKTLKRVLLLPFFDVVDGFGGRKGQKEADTDRRGLLEGEKLITPAFGPGPARSGQPLTGAGLIGRALVGPWGAGARRGDGRSRRAACCLAAPSARLPVADQVPRPLKMRSRPALPSVTCHTERTKQLGLCAAKVFRGAFSHEGKIEDPPSKLIQARQADTGRRFVGNTATRRRLGKVAPSLAAETRSDRHQNKSSRKPLQEPRPQEISGLFGLVAGWHWMLALHEPSTNLPSALS